MGLLEARRTARARSGSARSSRRRSTTRSSRSPMPRRAHARGAEDAPADHHQRAVRHGVRGAAEGGVPAARGQRHPAAQAEQADRQEAPQAHARPGPRPRRSALRHPRSPPAAAAPARAGSRGPRHDRAERRRPQLQARHDVRLLTRRCRCRGADLQVVKERLGHGSITTTEKYLHTQPDADDTALDALASIRARKSKKKGVTCAGPVIGPVQPR
jgi:hypothetical protein